MRLVVYIDDILLMAESKEKARDQANGLVYLMNCLGFTVNREKTTSEPSQTLEFLGFTVNTRAMGMSNKFGRSPGNCWRRGRFQQCALQTGWQDERRQSGDTTNVPPAPLFYRSLQIDLKAALLKSLGPGLRISPCPGSRKQGRADLVGLSRKFWSGENFGPAAHYSRKNGPVGPKFLWKNCPV